jgi:hypothetical protein
VYEWGTECSQGIPQSNFSLLTSDTGQAACDPGQTNSDPKGVFQVAAGATSKLYFHVRIPSTLASATLTVLSRSADSTHATAVQPYFAIVAPGSTITGLTYASAAASQNITNAASSGLTTTSYTLSVTGATAGNVYYGYLQIAPSSSATATFDLVSSTVQVQ